MNGSGKFFVAVGILALGFMLGQCLPNSSSEPKQKWIIETDGREHYRITDTSCDYHNDGYPSLSLAAQACKDRNEEEEKEKATTWVKVKPCEPCPSPTPSSNTIFTIPSISSLTRDVEFRTFIAPAGHIILDVTTGKYLDGRSE